MASPPAADMALAPPRDRLERNDRRFGWTLTLPGLIALSLIVLFPLLFTIFTSAYDYTLLHRRYDTFIGLENYREAFAAEYFGESLWVTLKFVIAVVALEFLLGFTVALMLNSVTRFKDVYYLILLMPQSSAVMDSRIL